VGKGLVENVIRGEGLAENVRIPLYGGRGLKLLKNRHMIFESSIRQELVSKIILKLVKRNKNGSLLKFEYCSNSKFNLTFSAF